MRSRKLITALILIIDGALLSGHLGLIAVALIVREN